ncbi:MAG TPA: DciA family protein [Fibrobacteria bacterium]|nr:DciA family protein [Fibrobacteria bacterium]HOX51864.1 DciA family protein [Fibrobacteria bacterium]
MNTPGPNRWLGGKELDKFRRKERAREEADAEPLKDLLGNYLQRSSLGNALLPASPAFQKAWNEAAGALASRCTPCKWERGTLWVDVPDPGWKFELRWRLAELAQAMRDRGIAVRQIRIR